MQNWKKSIILWFGLSLSFNSFALSTQQNIEIARIANFYGHRGGLRVKAWLLLLNKEKSASTLTKLTAINTFFNQMHYLSDETIWGQEDYWETPLEFLGVGAGDCEDYAIAKYYSLIKLGIKTDQLRMIYVKAIDLNEFHMVLAYYPTPTAVPLILDNLIGEIKPATERSDLLPIYSFNANNLWIIKQQGQSQLAGQASRLSRWDNLQRRVQQGDLRRALINYYE